MKNKLVSCDLLRIFSILLVLIHHLYVEMIYFKIISGSSELRWWGFSLGDLGVSLFVVISGLVLTISMTDKQYSWITFYKRRLVRIYPMFWIIYLPFLIYYLAKGYLSYRLSIPAYGLAFLGLDGYILSFRYFSNWNLIGEWFLGLIVSFYLIFPWWYRVMTKNKYMFLVINIMILFISARLFNNMVNLIRWMPVRLLEFSVGMFLASIIRKGEFMKLLVVAGALVGGNFVCGRLSLVGVEAAIPKLLLIDIGLIIVFEIVARFIRSMWILKSIAYLSALSFPVFLTHHIIIKRYLNTLANYKISGMVSITENVVVIILIVLVASAVALKIETKLTKIFTGNR